MSITLINAHHLPQGQRGKFLRHRTETTRVYARMKGVVESRLHENAGVGNSTVQFINIALRASTDAFIQVHKDYVLGEESIPGWASTRPPPRRWS